MPDGQLGSAIVVLVFLTFLAVGAVLAAGVGRLIARRRRGDGAPVSIDRVAVVGRRRDDHGDSTSYFVTFEFGDGNRREFAVAGAFFNELAEGDRGRLTHRDRRLVSFHRDRTIEAR